VHGGCYCATPADRVAYSASGAGPALLFESGWVTHLRGQLELSSFDSFIERLAGRFTVIRYDKPGCGLPDRDGIDLSFDGQVAAALAVAGLATGCVSSPGRWLAGRCGGAVDAGPVGHRRRREGAAGGGLGGAGLPQRDRRR
jgi:hypothetical protein